MNRQKAFDMCAELYLQGISPDSILDEILNNFMSGDEAVAALAHCFDQFGLDEYEDEDDD